MQPPLIQLLLLLFTAKTQNKHYFGGWGSIEDILPNLGLADALPYVASSGSTELRTLKASFSCLSMNKPITLFAGVSRDALELASER